MDLTNQILLLTDHVNFFSIQHLIEQSKSILPFQAKINGLKSPNHLISAKKSNIASDKIWTINSIWIPRYCKIRLHLPITLLLTRRFYDILWNWRRHFHSLIWFLVLTEWWYEHSLLSVFPPAIAISMLMFWRYRISAS